ncbi:LacI family DNA-binding transcriptional regulator [Arenibacter aquaticus]|uniref:LacI family DNA-binding transcriptional regulator n=1 Tax=Arenibacter aquaticus TaxID=2489054 RepID=A0A430JZA1_9FLAO|nr:LacI family DNA-binding transcriptional regulator [Arenibacter aquaticus]RTE52219.1 LacI family DNA-binding transcriptional regulator [Arenibacter aquaticus]
MTTRKYTIKDIANLAGVSKGTVDRVLHKRGKVSRKAFEQVDKVLKEIDYKPNPIARNLRTNKIYNIHVVLPDPSIDPYWLPTEEGINMALKRYSSFGIVIHKYLYNPNDISTFLLQTEKAIQSSPDVLLMAPIFESESQEVFEKCFNNNIKVVVFNNHINTTLSEQIFIGQDLKQSGRVAASLMEKISKKNDSVAIVHINKEPHMQLKEDGFVEYFKEKKEGRTCVISKNLNSTKNACFVEEVRIFSEMNPQISNWFVTNSKAHLLVEALEIVKKKDYNIIGYDLLPKNIRCLKEGKIAFLIHQKPKRQAFLGISYLAEHFLFGKNIPSREFLPIDVITTENLHYYI